jgi:hypothetical protein
MERIKFHTLYPCHLTIADLAGLNYETILAGNAAGDAPGTLGKAALETLTAADSAFRANLVTARRSRLTEQIRDFNKRRDSAFREIRRTAKAAAKSSNAAAAGQTLATFLHPYRNATMEPVLSKTAEINYLQTRFDAERALQDAAAALQLDGVFANLFHANRQVSLLWNARADEDAEKSGPSPSSLRRELEKCYGNFCDVTVQSLRLQPSPALEKLFHVMNEIRIKYARSLPVRLTGGNTSVDAIPAQPYTGKPVTPVPRVLIRAGDGTSSELRFTVDYYVTYRNNIDIGEAKILIHGKGRYTGLHTSTFHIEQPRREEL